MRNSEGALLLAKTGVVFEEEPKIEVDYSASGHCIFVTWKICDVQMVMLYKSPKYSKSRFTSKLEEIFNNLSGNVIVFGDININLQEDGEQFVELLRSNNLMSKLRLQDPTTDYGTHIDCCFSNIDGLVVWMYESYFSYHKPICMALPKL